MMKITLRLIAILLVVSLTYCGNAIRTEWNTFRCNSDSKCRGLDFSLKFPNNWITMEGERPHIIQKFRKEVSGGSIELVIYLNDFERSLNSEEIYGIYELENLTSGIPVRRTMEYDNEAKIDGIPSVILTLSVWDKVYNEGLSSIIVMNVLVWNQYLLQFNFFVFSDDQRLETMKRILKESEEIIEEIMLSVIIQSQWE